MVDNTPTSEFENIITSISGTNNIATVAHGRGVHEKNKFALLMTELKDVLEEGEVTNTGSSITRAQPVRESLEQTSSALPSTSAQSSYTKNNHPSSSGDDVTEREVGDLALREMETQRSLKTSGSSRQPLENSLPSSKPGYGSGQGQYSKNKSQSSSGKQSHSPNVINVN